MASKSKKNICGGKGTESVKIEFKRPDYCDGCRIAKLYIDSIDAGTWGNPRETVNVLKCRNDAPCEEMFKRITVIKK
jgi:hypothetical protein